MCASGAITAVSGDSKRRSAGVCSILAFKRDGKLFRPVKPLKLHREVFGFQGGFISAGGKLYLTGQAVAGEHTPFTVLVFSMTDDEVEDIALFRLPQIGTDVQVVVLENDIEDDVRLHGFIVPDPSAL